MPHRKNAKGDIGFQKRMSDSTNINNVYLTEEGWVYRHYKRADKSRWYDEVIVAGQVKTDLSTPEDMVIHGVENAPVAHTLNDVPEDYPEFETGGGPLNVDIDYKPHVSGDKLSARASAPADIGVSVPATGKPWVNIPWDAINASDSEDGILDTQIPEGWSGVSSPSDVDEYPNEPPYPGGAGDGGAGSGDGIGWTYDEIEKDTDHIDLDPPTFP